MARLTSIILTASLLFLGACSVRADHNAKTPLDSSSRSQGAVMAADSWLTLLDNGQYDSSWSQAAELFKATYTRSGWADWAGLNRRPLGKVLSRRLSKVFSPRLLVRGSTGPVMSVVYETSFENKGRAVETVTVHQENDGTWRVAGYRIS